MGLTKRRDSYYVEFRVIDSEDGKSLILASGEYSALNEEKIKNWVPNYKGITHAITKPTFLAYIRATLFNQQNLAA